ncbi:MAG: hypothetical protein A2W90_08825 [Bacteroidetes bacterium GWF2_42_66]|nr:MAG: hypothetical protein A2W92_17560 [Bacteroidetes bacterium GWA2_42_15]OFX96772.1 MAG: hypothetical protein A2W89_21410 [Bacteroidetes bacterium GWE2_42_39]OFY45464.1 MAG: hypothetical protein A2W90_08825 [Bacteroidetes bacterium GWF2_42_66]HBL76151.1 hypothetical protein [Prolixibacteraceae bacterium]HCR91561.1 hypothetical protein [Prolixibacteraceae bacterium]
MEEYIFIILAIILSIVGAVNKNKKKTAGTTGSGIPSFFEKMMGESLFDEEPVVNSPKQETAPSSHPSMPKQKKETLVRRQPFLSHELAERGIPKRASGLKKVENIQKKEPVKKKERIHDLMKGFSMKKAIIYSEIIQTKY